MLNLRYILIGDLPERQKRYLKWNLMEDRAEEEGIQTVIFGQTGKCSTLACGETELFWQLRVFPAEESIFISEDDKELKEAEKLGMATVGYLRKEQRENHMEIVEASHTNTDMWAEGFEEIGFLFLKHVYERHHGIPWTILTTERCVIKEFSMDYLDDLFELYAGEGMTDYIEPLYSYEEERAYQEAYIRNMYGFFGYGMWIVCDKKNGKLIGRAGVEYREELNGKLELGYAIGVPYQRHGYATEVCKAILAYVKEELKQPLVCCLIEEKNVVSQYFAEKLGFVSDGSILIDKKQMKKYSYIF